MPHVDTNEREYQGWLLGELRASKKPPVTDVTQETTVAGLFPDIIFWKDRDAGIGLATCELKDTSTPANDSEMLQNGNRKCLDVGARLLVTWNMSATVVWSAHPAGPRQLWEYDSIPVPGPKGWRRVQSALRSRAKELMADLIRYDAERIPPPRAKLDSTFFVDAISSAVERLVPIYTRILQDRRLEAAKWAASQGVPTDDQFETAARHVVYRLVGKLLFYHALSNYRGDLPRIVKIPVDPPSEFLSELNRYFEKARQIDYQAIFEPRWPDDLVPTREAVRVLVAFSQGLAHADLRKLSVDIVGRVFENIIPEEDRHRLGQYFTEDTVSDLLNAFALRSGTESVLDPACGTGSILLRSYEFLRKLGKRSHGDALAQIWGNDLADFPTELATINLYRLEPDNFDEYPRILHSDFFDLRPASRHEFPPPKSRTLGERIGVPLPTFDAVVGNPPYVRYQKIGEATRSPAAYKEKLRKLAPSLTSEADLYVYFFIHARAFLRDGGTLAFVTSNAWLENEYGLKLQQLFTTRWRIVAIMESRCEPWFENAKVNTVITILEKVPDSTFMREGHAQLDKNLVRFVSFKKPLAGIVEVGPHHASRVDRFLRLRAEVEATASSNDGRDLRIRVVPQGDLRSEVAIASEINKWGLYLRAPDCYLRLRAAHGGPLVGLRDVMTVDFGTLTGRNEFWAPQPTHAAYEHLQRVERRFRVRILHKIKDCDRYVVESAHCRSELFYCDETMRDLAGTQALKYIQWGARQRDETGTHWKESGEAARRPQWYTTRRPVRGDVVFQMMINDRHVCPANPHRYAVLNNALAGSVTRRKDSALVVAILNSVWMYLSLELEGRINFGEGLLKVERIDLLNMRMPDPHLIKEGGHDARIMEAWQRLQVRSPLPIHEEVAQSDRQALDEAVFDFLELTQPERRAVREAIVELCENRKKIARLRKQRQTARRSRDSDLVIEDILSEIIPNGFRRFPEDFIPPGMPCREVTTPAGGLEVVYAPRMEGQEGLFGSSSKYRLRGSGSYVIEVDTENEVQFLHRAQTGSSRTVQVPRHPSDLQGMLSAYQVYCDDVHRALFEAVHQRVFRASVAEQLVGKIMKESSVRIDDLEIPRAARSRTRRG